MGSPSNPPSILSSRHPDSGKPCFDAVTAADGDMPVYDLIVIGGGINGSGIARDAAMRGLTVLLLEKEDFGSGTSAYSSRLIHGGLRYLANLELDLVYESLRERELLLRNAPHLVRPLPMAIPTYSHSQKPCWMVGLGMWLYDLLSWGKRMPSHRMYGRDEFLKRYPVVNSEGLQGGPVYYDAQVAMPERICVENAIATLETGNATVLNHARVTNFLHDGNELTGVVFEDVLSGTLYPVGGRVIVNASGPWVDGLLHQVGVVTGQPQTRRIGGTKGSHIIVRRFPDGPDTALYVEARSDGRPFFIIPWLNAYYLIGTTDLRFEGDPDAVAADRDEVAYLLAETNAVLPAAKLTERDVLYTYSGIRPLPYTEGKNAGKITRKHWIVDHALNAQHPVQRLVSIIGGKLTTYRNLAEEAVDYCVGAYQLRSLSGCQNLISKTRQMPLPGGVGIESIESYKRTEIPEASRQYPLSEVVVSHLIDQYGSRYRQVLQLLDENPGWKQPLTEHSVEIAAQVIYAIRYELALTVCDVLLRRLQSGFDAERGLDALETVTRLMAAELQWTDSRICQEQATYRQAMESRNPVGGHNLSGPQIITADELCPMPE